MVSAADEKSLMNSCCHATEAAARTCLPYPNMKAKTDKIKNNSQSFFLFFKYFPPFIQCLLCFMVIMEANEITKKSSHIIVRGFGRKLFIPQYLPDIFHCVLENPKCSRMSQNHGNTVNNMLIIINHRHWCNKRYFF